MTPRALALLAAVSLAAAGGATMLWLKEAPPATAPIAQSQLMFPGLVDRLQAAQRIEIKGKDTLVLERKDGVWGLADRAFYPVQQGRVREALTGLTELRLTERRTADPAQLKALNLDEPGSADSTALRLTVQDGTGATIAEAVLGRRRVRMAGNLPEAIYVRRPAETQAWVAEGSVRVDAERNLWIDRDLLDIKRVRVATATLTQGDAVLRVARAAPSDERFRMVDPPEGHEADESKVDDVGRALEWLTLDDVLPRTALEGADTKGEAVWTLFDGTRITARVLEKDGVRHATFDVAWSAPEGELPTGPEMRTAAEAEAQAKEAQARLGAWAYRLPDWKMAILVSSLESVRVAPPPTPPAPGTSN
jgi:hypothetical protein